MAKLRSVNTQFWTDEYAQSLAPNEKYLFLYLLTNPLVTIAGAYKISMKTITFETGIKADAADKILDKFKADGKVIYKDGWIVLTNFLKNQNLNTNMVKGVVALLTDAPAWVTASVWKSIKAFETLRKAFEPFETLRKEEVEEEVEVEEEREGESVIAETAPRPTKSTPKLTDAEWIASIQQKAAYSGIDVAREFGKAETWAETNNRKVTRRFFVNWLNGVRPVEVKAKPQKESSNGYDPRKDINHPDYEMTPARTDFESEANVYFTVHDDGTREKYEQMKLNWLSSPSGKGHKHEIEDYERSYKFRQRFSEERQASA